MIKLNTGRYDRTELLKDSMDTISNYLSRANRIIDEQYGTGYAAKNPSLVGDLVQAMSREYGAGSIALSLEAAGEIIKEGANSVAIQLEDLK